MKSNRTKLRIGGAIVVLFLLFVLVPVSQQTVQAQNRNDVYGQDYRYGNQQNRRGRSWDSYPNWGGSFDLRQTALNAGYNEGMKDGTSARQRNRNYNDFRNQSAYKKATKDYSSRLGDRNLYQRYFREAYETGFNDGFNPQGSYNNDRDRDRDWNRNNNGNNGNWDRNNRRGRNWDRYDNYGGSSNLRQTALNAGYNEGIKEGRKDRNGNGRPDFRNNSAYQKATTDYSSKLGDRNLYQRYYREGYENGYYDGLNGN